ncbi:MAG: glutathione peroxidase, partial [bacterium]
TKVLFVFSLSVLQITLMSCSRSPNQNTGNQSNNIQVKNKIEGIVKLNKNIYDLSVRTMNGETKKLSDYKDKVLLIVNVASKCGFTPQYEGLERLYNKYNGKGFEILAFPCNDFGEQEPGTNEEIKTFCETKYNVTFPLFDKVKVLGDDKSQLYDRLVSNSEPAGDISWNFEKFLIDKNGNIAGRYKSKIKPESEELISAIETEINK